MTTLSKMLALAVGFGTAGAAMRANQRQDPAHGRADVRISRDSILACGARAAEAGGFVRGAERNRGFVSLMRITSSSERGSVAQALRLDVLDSGGIPRLRVQTKVLEVKLLHATELPVPKALVQLADSIRTACR